MEQLLPTTFTYQPRSYDEENDAHTSKCQLVRRKRPRALELNHDALLTRKFRDKTPRLMILPGFAELVAAQKQRNEGATEVAVLDVLSRESNARQEHHHQQQQWMQQTKEEEMELEDKTPWPSAQQYYDIFMTHKTKLTIPVYNLGMDTRGVPLHPEFIYSEPMSCMYFLRCPRLLGKGSFGFPRKSKRVMDRTSSPAIATNAGKTKSVVKEGKKELSKDFEWRKMSFVTGLPKKQPIVRYITATCYSRATDIALKKKVFRMHAVMLADEAGTGERGKYVLVHIRAGGSKRVGIRAALANAETFAAPKYLQ